MNYGFRINSILITSATEWRGGDRAFLFYRNCPLNRECALNRKCPLNRECPLNRKCHLNRKCPLNRKCLFNIDDPKLPIHKLYITVERTSGSGFSIRVSQKQSILKMHIIHSGNSPAVSRVNTSLFEVAISIRELRKNSPPSCSLLNSMPGPKRDPPPLTHSNVNQIENSVCEYLNPHTNGRAKWPAREKYSEMK